MNGLYSNNLNGVSNGAYPLDYKSAIVSSGLIAHYDFSKRASYIGTGDTVINIANPLLYGGILQNSPTFYYFKKGSILLNGVNQYIDLGTNFNFTNEDFSFSIWVNFVKFTTNDPGNPANILFKGNRKESGYYIQMQSSGGVQFWTNQAGATQTSTSTSRLTINRWYNLSFTRTGTSILIYFDGIKQPQSKGVHKNPVSSSRNFFIGQDISTAFYSNMSIASFSVYNKFLTAQEVLQNYLAMKINFNL